MRFRLRQLSEECLLCRGMWSRRRRRHTCLFGRYTLNCQVLSTTEKPGTDQRQKFKLKTTGLNQWEKIRVYLSLPAPFCFAQNDEKLLND